ncbi:hypothetical protein GCM10010381_61410 [Streptomyces xantholiticus]|nr:hypothetical protein GCM10010381_61410 [Streptomyces xantholiticus]
MWAHHPLGTATCRHPNPLAAECFLSAVTEYAAQENVSRYKLEQAAKKAARHPEKEC